LDRKKKGALLGTFAVGTSFNTTVETKALASMMFDLNLISKAGFTLCSTDAMGFSTGGDFFQNIYFGAGYHYMRDSWNIGGSILFSPTAHDMIIAGKIDGGYYFTDTIGISGIIMYGQTTGLGYNLSICSIQAGISVRIK
jgi:hypothetical protein